MAAPNGFSGWTYATIGANAGSMVYGEKLAEYFEVAKDVLLNAGVAIINPDYDPTEVYSQYILITHPERICSYDETRSELDCTRP